MWLLRDFDFTLPKSNSGHAQRPTPMRGIFWLTIPAACCASLLTAVVTNADLRHESLKKPEDFANALRRGREGHPASALYELSSGDRSPPPGGR